MSRRLAAFALLFAAVSASGQLADGTVIFLQSVQSSQQLSAHPGEGFAFSPNRAAWEQFKYYSNRLLTVHGTTPLQDGYDDTFGHKPVAARDSMFLLVPVYRDPRDGVLRKGGSDPIADGSLVAITSPSAYCVGESGGRVVFERCPYNMNAFAFRVSLASNPVSHPTRKEAAIADQNSVRTASGRWVQHENNSGAPIPGRAAHRTQQPQYITKLVNSGSTPERPLRYGESRVFLQALMPNTNAPGFQPVVLGPWRPDSAGQPVDLRGLHFVSRYYTAFDDYNSWTIRDPLSIHKNGDRVALNENICFSKGGSQLQADPGQLYFGWSTNCAGWEHFVLHAH